MGVTGLWRLVEPTGQPVPVESLENKVLAVDISIWLHQMVKGYQDAKGAPLPNAHLMGLFQRLCKLLYFKIKPVFVFDGAFPDLKKETIHKRQDNKNKYQSESERLKRELALLLSKKTAVSSLLGQKISPKKNYTNQTDDDIFKLPALPENNVETESEPEDEDTSSGSIIDLHTVDLESENFKKMNVKEKYDLLVELKETRKMNSWGKIHELPKKSDNFSDFQMQRLLKRRKVQECLEETEKEMGSTGMSLNELESLLNEEGIDTKIDTLPTRHIASSDTTRFLLISNMKQALADAKNKEIAKRENNALKNNQFDNNLLNIDSPGTSKAQDITKAILKKDEFTEDLDKAIKMSLECVNEKNTNMEYNVSKTDESWSTFMTDSDYSCDSTDSAEDDGYEPPSLSSAKAYIMQYTDFTNKAIKEMVKSKKSAKKVIKPRINEIMDEIKNENSIIKDHVDLSSDEDIKKPEANKCKNDITMQSNTIRENLEKNMYEKSMKQNVSDSKFKESGVVCTGEVDDNFYHDSFATSEKKVQHTHNDEIDEELQRAIKMSLECVGENSNDKILNASDTDLDINERKLETIKSGTNIADDKLQEVIEKKKLNLVKCETSSTDDEFEEVSELPTLNKPVIQLSVDLHKAPEDDIFADVFSTAATDEPVLTELEKKEENVNTIPLHKNDEPIENNHNLESKLECQSRNEEEINLNNKVHISLKSNSPRKYENLIDKSQHNEGNKKVLKDTVTPIKLTEVFIEMENQEEAIIQEKGRLDRVGRNITEQMTKEAQELLQIFGIPYIVAPMEAEAQCAFLESTKLTDGTITDDSDIWLFGGKTVYKNFFNQKKHVLQFLNERIEKAFNLSREQLILLAMLVGSDYTTGVPGVGPVTALEILASFPYNKKGAVNEAPQNARYAQLIEGLLEFKKWVRSGKKTDNTSLKKKLKNVKVNDDFPSIRIVQAYLEPNIDKNKDIFLWGELDLTVLRDYAKSKFGWSQNKLDEIVKPVIKRLQDRNTQKNIKDYFTRNVKFQNLEDQMSKRVKAAVQKMGPDASQEENNTDTVPIKTKKIRKRKKHEGLKEAEKLNKIQRKHSEEVPINVLKVETVKHESETEIQVVINKTNKYQEIIPQREKEKHGLLQNKMKAIEVFRRTKLDTKYQRKKRQPLVPKDKAMLSESSDSD